MNKVERIICGLVFASAMTFLTFSTPPSNHHRGNSATIQDGGFLGGWNPFIWFINGVENIAQKAEDKVLTWYDEHVAGCPTQSCHH